MQKHNKMNARTRIETGVIYIVFAFYLLFLLKLLIFSRVSLTDNGLDAARSVNLIPFASVMGYVRGGSEVIERFALSNVVGNILIFIPLGAYLPLVKRGKRITSHLVIIFTWSLLVEIIQGVFGMGTADIDDIILNCLGGLIGVWGYRLLLLILGKESRARTAMAIFSAAGLPVLLYYTFVIKLRL